MNASIVLRSPLRVAGRRRALASTVACDFENVLLECTFSFPIRPETTRIGPSPSSRNGATLRYHLAMPTRKADARTYPTITRAEAEAWRDLHRQLARTRTLQDAKDIAAQAAPPYAKRFYAHLRSFVRTLQSPRRGTRSELYVYGKLRRRFADGRQPAA